MVRQPNSNDCFVCGRHNPYGLHLTFYDNGRDEVAAEYTVPAHYQGYPGLVHGGIAAAILDEVLGRVAMIGNPNRFMMSVKLEVKYRQPIPIETPLKISGRLVKLRGRLAQAEGFIYLPDETVAAEAFITLADVPAGVLPAADLSALGWRVDSAGIGGLGD
ncbi:MAG: PaaI family thioesterase [Chloroflexota bacterium]